MNEDGVNFSYVESFLLRAASGSDETVRASGSWQV